MVTGMVLRWPDTFTNHFHPHVGIAAVGVLEDAGWRVELPLTPVLRPDLGLHRATGHRQGDPYSHRARLAEHVRTWGYAVGLEPSCATVFRADAADLFPDDQDVLRLRDHVLTLAELTERTPGWERRG